MNPFPGTVGTLDRNLLMAVLDAMPVGAFLIENGTIYCNRQAGKITGYGSDELSTLDDFYLRLFRDQCRRARELFEAERDDASPVTRVCAVIGKDGRTKVVEFTVCPAVGSGRVLCTMHDVTDCYRPDLVPSAGGGVDQRTLVCNTLRESAERYRMLSELTSDFTFLAIRSGNEPFRVHWMGGAVEQITGYSESDILKKGCWLNLVHPEDRDRVGAHLLELHPGQCSSEEFRMISKNGQTLWVRGIYRCESGPAAGETSLYGASRDITASKLAEVALKDIEEIFRLFLEYSPAYLVFKDADHKVLRLSRNFETLLQRPLEELIGKTAADIFPPATARKIMTDDLKVLNSGLLSETEEVLQGRFYSSLKFPIPQKDKPPLLVSIKTDITERKEIEVAVKQLNERLDKRVAQRTAQLEAAILEQEAFSYSVSHDLRAPLRHINSFCAILQEECSEFFTDECRGYLDRIRGATRKMGILIDELLELSRVSRVQMQRVPVNLSDLTARISLNLKEMEPDRVVEVVVVPDLYACCDPILVRQLFENLLGNAWKYTSHQAESRIEFGMLSESDGPVFFIKDNGAGFDMAYRDKLFQPFQRLHGAEFEGNGIGLATAQRIVHRHGGSIWAEGAVGQGAQFFFTLP
jgi:PAS domain S-box-containing protein